MSELVFTYIAPEKFPEHIWACVGPEFAMHIHIMDRGEGAEDVRYSGGLEFHYRAAPDYMDAGKASHEKCWLLNAPCWHDGTSLYALDVIIPFWLIDPTNNERMFDFLKREYEKNRK